MDHLQASLDTLCEHASKKDLNYREFLEQALAQEWGGCHQSDQSNWGVVDTAPPAWPFLIVLSS